MITLEKIAAAKHEKKDTHAFKDGYLSGLADGTGVGNVVGLVRGGQKSFADGTTGLLLGSSALHARRKKGERSLSGTVAGGATGTGLLGAGIGALLGKEMHHAGAGAAIGGTLGAGVGALGAGVGYGLGRLTTDN